MSQRDYRFRVRKAFDGKAIVAVTASEPGTKPTVTKKAGRFIVAWSTKGKTFPKGGVLRSMMVRATLAGGRKVRLQWLYRPCAARDNNLNDNSASGLATAR